MRKVEAHSLESLYAVRIFLDEYATALPHIATGWARTRLDESIAAIEQHVTDQSAHLLIARGITQRHRALRRRLVRSHMATIAAIAKAVDPPIPELLPFRMPHGKPTPHRLAAMAQGMAHACAPFAEAFIAAGLPRDFIAQLDRAAEAMLQSLSERSGERQQSRAATIGLRTKLLSARRHVGVLDALITSAAAQDTALLGAWDSAKHVRRPSRHAASSADANVTQPAEPSPVDLRNEAAPTHWVIALVKPVAREVRQRGVLSRMLSAGSANRYSSSLFPRTIPNSSRAMRS